MQIIAELDAAPRGPYWARIGYLGVTGALDTSVVIRNVRSLRPARSDLATLGAGIVARLRSGAAEYQETLDKPRGP